MKKKMLLFAFKLLKVLPIFGLLFLSACELTTNSDLEELQKKFDSPEGCFSCQFFRVVYNTGAKMSTEAYDGLCNIATYLLVIGLTAWLFWHVFTLLITLREPNLAQFWIQLFQKLLKGGFVAILVSSKERLYELVNSVFEPIAFIFIDLSTKLLQNNWFSRISLTTTLNNNFSSGPGFPSAIGVALDNLIYRITLALNVGRVLGLRLMLQSDIINFWLGLVTTCVFFLMSLFFPFYLIDGFIRLAVVFILLPIFLVGWVFKWSEAYIKKAFDMFIAAFAQVMLGCIFVSLCVTVFEGFIKIRGYGYLLSPTVQNVDIIFKEEANRMSFSFLSFLLISVYMYKLSKGIPKIVSHFTGVSTSSIIAGAIERFKKFARATVLATTALVATCIGMGHVAQMAAKQAQKDGKEAIGGK